MKDQFARLTAEYDNYRKRTTKEKDGIYQDAKGDTIREFLAVYDNLERAAAGEDDGSPHKKGLDMIFQQFRDLLQKLGVEKICAKDQPFDPETMNAVMHIDDETLGENHGGAGLSGRLHHGRKGYPPRHRSGGKLKQSIKYAR